MYKPPSTSESVLQNEVGHIVDLKEKLDCKKVIVAGDFNVDAAKGNIVSAFQQLGYQQLIKQSTTKNGTIIDHVYTDSDVSKCDVAVTYFSYHNLSFAVFDIWTFSYFSFLVVIIHVVQTVV